MTELTASEAKELRCPFQPRDANYNCIAEQCMAWRDFKFYGDKEDRGYCKLIGRIA